MGDVQSLNIGSKKLNRKYKQSPNKGMGAKRKNESRNQRNNYNEYCFCLAFAMNSHKKVWITQTETGYGADSV